MTMFMLYVDVLLNSNYLQSFSLDDLMFLCDSNLAGTDLETKLAITNTHTYF